MPWTKIHNNLKYFTFGFSRLLLPVMNLMYYLHIGQDSRATLWWKGAAKHSVNTDLPSTEARQRL